MWFIFETIVLRGLVTMDYQETELSEIIFMYIWFIAWSISGLASFFGLVYHLFLKAFIRVDTEDLRIIETAPFYKKEHEIKFKNIENVNINLQENSIEIRETQGIHSIIFEEDCQVLQLFHEKLTEKLSLTNGST